MPPGACHRHQVGLHGAQDAQRVHAAVLIEALVLGCQDGLLHDWRDLVYADYGTTLLAELAEQIAVRRVNPQRYLGAVVRKNLERRQVRVGQAKDHGHHGKGYRGKADNNDDGVEDPAEGSRQHGVRKERQIPLLYWRGHEKARRSPRRLPLLSSFSHRVACRRARGWRPAHSRQASLPFLPCSFPG
jgi:hypothetical protein